MHSTRRHPLLALVALTLATGFAFPLRGGEAAAIDDPVADPGGPYRGFVNEPVQFNGSGSSDSDGVIVNYRWDFESAPDASGPGFLLVERTWSAPGVYEVHLQVTDIDGDTNEAETKVTIVVPQPPQTTIDSPAGNVTIEAGQSVSFTGTATDPDEGAITAYSWSFLGGSPSSSSVEDPGPVLYATPGTYSVTFDATDDEGESDPTPATRTITVTPTPPNQPPEATINSPAGNVTIEAGQTVSFAGTGTDPDGGGITAYSWSFPGGTPPASSVEDPGAVLYATPGNYTATFNVTDDEGASDPTPATRTITVTELPPPNQPPEATIDSPAGNVTIQAGQSVSFAGTGSDPDGVIAVYSWSFPGGTPASSSVEDPGPVLYTTPGNFTATFNVTDDKGASDPTPDSRTITVTSPSGNNQPPSARIDSPAGNVTIQVGGSVNYRGSGLDSDGSVVAYSWTFAGGTPAGSTLKDPGTVVYNTPGNFTTSFNVTDDDGASDPTPATRAITVTVSSPANQAPNAVIDSPFSDVTIEAGESVSFAGTGTDADGTIAAYSWSLPGGSPASSTVEDPGPVVYAAPGEYTATFNVTDDDGASDSTPATRTITVTPPGGGGGNVGEFNVELAAPGSANRVDGHDVIFVLRAIATQDLRGDVNGDRIVNQQDVALVLDALGEVE